MFFFCFHTMGLNTWQPLFSPVTAAPSSSAALDKIPLIARGWRGKKGIPHTNVLSWLYALQPLQRARFFCIVFAEIWDRLKYMYSTVLWAKGWKSNDPPISSVCVFFFWCGWKNVIEIAAMFYTLEKHRSFKTTSAGLGHCTCSRRLLSHVASIV
jgi:hypothetical protein